MENEHSKVSGRSFSEVKHALRVSFSKLGIIQTHVPDVPMLAVTATADKQTEKDIVKSLCKNLMLRVSPNRPNIRLFVFKRTKLEKKTKREKCPKSIVYCQNIEAVAKVFTIFKLELSDTFFIHCLVSRHQNRPWLACTTERPQTNRRTRSSKTCPKQMDFMELLWQLLL